MLDNPEMIMQPSDMTVGDLIQALLAYHPDLKICTPCYEGGFTPIHRISRKELLLNVNTEYYYGPHDELDSVPDPLSYEKETFLLISK